MIILGVVVVAALGVLQAAAGRLTMGRFVDLLTLIPVIAPVALAPVVAAVWARMGHNQPHASNKLWFLLMVLPTLSGRTMSLWFLSLVLANGIQAQTMKLYDDVSKPAYFAVDGAIGVVRRVVIALAPWLRRTMHPVH